MHRQMLERLVAPKTLQPLTLEVARESADGDVLEGWLRGREGEEFPIQGGIPRLLAVTDAGQAQTSDSFGFKWRQRQSYEAPALRAFFGDWLAKRYGFADPAAMRAYLAGHSLVLDAGCGGGYSAGVWRMDSWEGLDYLGVDISQAVEEARDRLGTGQRAGFVQADVLELPLADGSVDLVFSEGVLHHTPSTRQAMASVARVLKPGGELMCYLYRRKAPLREFTDDYVRGLICDLPPQEAWEALRPLTRLGQALAELGVQVEVPEDVPLLGIKAGRYDVQRLIYWHFAKLFWNPDLELEANHHVNFDWYHPRYAHRQSEQECRQWCGELGLAITRFHAEESGFTIRAVKQ